MEKVHDRHRQEQNRHTDRQGRNGYCHAALSAKGAWALVLGSLLAAGNVGSAQADGVRLEVLLTEVSEAGGKLRASLYKRLKGVRPFAVIGGISSGLKSRERSCPYAFLAQGSGV